MKWSWGWEKGPGEEGSHPPTALANLPSLQHPGTTEGQVHCRVWALGWGCLLAWPYLNWRENILGRDILPGLWEQWPFSPIGAPEIKLLASGGKNWELGPRKDQGQPMKRRAAPGKSEKCSSFETLLRRPGPQVGGKLGLEPAEGPCLFPSPPSLSLPHPAL